MREITDALPASFGTVRKALLQSRYAHLVKRPGRPKEHGEQSHLKLVGSSSDIAETVKVGMVPNSPDREVNHHG